ncbi:SDR family oxidoreductase [Agromyces laixinhei]|uniref:SDR family oxidoreductase n=1 Tax=Agromyces laixinhei TaxID=2585717 RepID=UPI0012EE8BC5|nr:SDR family oxidoreductase [Agromyces laixinhei]
MARIVIFGGHGKIALRLARLAAERGDEVDAIIRNPEHADDVVAAGARPIVADIERLDVDDVAEILHGHDAVVWSAGAGGGDPARTYAVDRDAAIRSMTAAEQAGVTRYVMVSYLGSPDHRVPEGDSFHAYAESKAAADERLAASSLHWTILGPSTLTDGEGTGLIDIVATSSGTVDRADVAAVALESVHRDSTVGRTLRFNGGGTPIAEALA